MVLPESSDATSHTGAAGSGAASIAKLSWNVAFDAAGGEERDVISRHPERRGVYQLRTELWLPQPRAHVFEFFADAGNLESITPPWLNFHVLTARPFVMCAGALIDYRLKLHGIPVRWQTEIAAWEPPCRFVDRQKRGPYRFWIHEHQFEDRDGGTRVTDQVDYAVPGGWLVHRYCVQPDLEQIFEYRQAAMLRRFTGASPEQEDLR